MERRFSGVEKASIEFALCMALMAFLAGFVLPKRTAAQVVGGTLLGTVTDPSGALVPNVEVIMKNTATGVVTTVATNSQGLYSAPNLLPGNYQVTFSCKGFTTEVRTGIVLTVGAQQVLNVAMRVGDVSQVIQVTGAPPIVQLASSTISANVNATTVRELPLNGRSWTDLATLQPGITSIHAIVSTAHGPDRIGRGLGAQVSITGGRPQDDNYLVNGITINDFANGTPGSVIGTNLGVDAVQEFSILTTNYSAEYGRTSGGVVSAITRSGTNAFHGNVYEFLRNSSLDAANFFDNFSNSTIPEFRRNQFGASAGGPIQKDRTFIFGDYEGLRQALGVSQVDTVPSLAARSGVLSTGTVTVDRSVAPFLSFYPLPNGPIIAPGDTAVFAFGSPSVASENYGIIRMDHTFSNKDSMDGTYTYDAASSSQPDEFNNKLVFNGSRRQLVTLEETHIFNPSMVNTLRLGVNRVHAAAPQNATAINSLAASTALG
ncbi:MAG: carboxypeptidase regulatory-like domain-containing protein, partial [Terriglobia bacterium]